MNPTSHVQRFDAHERYARPLLAAAAALAAVATFGLAVIGPAVLSRAQAPIAAATRPAVIEVAIVPGTIEVTAARVKTAEAGSPYVPATYNVR
jgi:hypothetical protein